MAKNLFFYKRYQNPLSQQLTWRSPFGLSHIQSSQNEAQWQISQNPFGIKECQYPCIARREHTGRKGNKTTQCDCSPVNLR